MASNNKNVDLIKLSSNLIERCNNYARDVAVRYGSGDKLHAMPWTRCEMTDDDLRTWLASRATAGEAVDIETCELGRWAACDDDPYGIRKILGEEPLPIVSSAHLIATVGFGKAISRRPTQRRCMTASGASGRHIVVITPTNRMLSRARALPHNEGRNGVRHLCRLFRGTTSFPFRWRK